VNKEKIEKFPENFAAVVKVLRKMSQEDAISLTETLLFLGTIIGTEGALTQQTMFADGLFNCLDTCITAEDKKLAESFAKHWATKVSGALAKLVLPEEENSPE
jgi:hypothetical protein